ncbi:MAG TPA: hydrogenase/urease maturation nickel metallochaperone HypA, partial [Actinoplanes sp.]|nr:hydrogenase/urease maturation nickel metallochaperone HypA [Actinoplanes sp.]
MHEISLVAELVEVCRARAADLPPGDRTVSVRYASTMPLEGLEHAFAMLIEGTELAGARLDAHLVERRLDCPACDFDGALEHDDVMAD